MRLKNLVLLMGIIFLASSLPASASSELPARLSIPKLKVDIALESVGLTTDGAVSVSKGLANAGWYNLSALPGESGSAVISGHYGPLKNGKMGVFTNLNKLRKGDKFFVKDIAGETTTFVVRESRHYKMTDDATEVFFSNDDRSHLNIVTCDGIWNKKTKRYSSRLVVFSDKE